MSRGKRPKQRSKKRGGDLRKRVAILAAVAILIPAAVVSAVLVLSSSDDHPEPTAAIVDQLSLSSPNPAFAETATDMLQQVGYTVDYYPGEEVTVDFYRDLPSQGYDFVVLRAHSSLTGVGVEATDDASLYTTEPYTETKYLDEQVARRLSIVSYYEGGPEYFGITPEFIRSSMKGKFDDATLIMMGCDALKSDAAAQAFVQKGAKAVASWDGPVSATHTDAATEDLLRRLLIDGLTMQEAVAQTMADIGPDPAYDSSLLAYP